MSGMKRLILTIAIITSAISNYAQSSLDELNVYLKRNFEENTAGRYVDTEFAKDWFNPPWCNRREELRIVKSTSDAVNPSQTLQLDFPANSLGPEEGGTHWQSPLPVKYEEIYVSYDVMFMPGFQFARGGKLPGIKGGSPPMTRPTGYDGFVAYMMFKGDRPVFYIYYPDNYLDEYGATFEWGYNHAASEFQPSKIVLEYASGAPSHFTPGKWHNITYRVVLNTVNASGGNFDGILEGYFDGKLVTQLSHVKFRNTTDIKIDKIVMMGFFGGSTDSWRNPIYEWIKLDNIMLYTFKNSSIPHGTQLSPTNRTISYWRNFSKTPTTPTPTPPQEVNNAPVVAEQSFVLRKSNFTNNSVGKVIATDKDVNQTLTYSIVSGNGSGLFAINGQTGLITTSTSNMFASGTTRYELVVKVADNGQQPLNNQSKIFITFLNQSETVYINPRTENDPMEDGSLLHPYNSWKDVEWVEGTTYYQRRDSKEVVDQITIGANNVVLDAYGSGELPIITSETNSYLLRAFEKQNITIKNLHLVSDNAVSCIYFLGATSNNNVIYHCVLEGMSNAIRIVEGGKFTIKYNLIKTQNEGIYTSATTNLIYYNVIKNSTNALNVFGSSSKASIFNNVFVDNEKSVSASYGELTLYNNIFYLMKSGQKAIVNGSDKIVSDYNIFYPQQDGFIEIAARNFSKLDNLQQEMKIDLHSFNADPEFMDVYAEDFTLKSNSPAVNAGIDLQLEEDYFGKNVPVSGLPDIGIYESNIFGNAQEENSINLSIYPNPSTGSVNILVESSDKSPLTTTMETATEEPSVSIIDITGKTVFTRFFKQAEDVIMENLDLSALKNGMYFVVFKLAGEINTEKLILQR